MIIASDNELGSSAGDRRNERGFPPANKLFRMMLTCFSRNKPVLLNEIKVIIHCGKTVLCSQNNCGGCLIPSE